MKQHNINLLSDVEYAQDNVKRSERSMQGNITEESMRQGWQKHSEVLEKYNDAQRKLGRHAYSLDVISTLRLGGGLFFIIGVVLLVAGLCIPEKISIRAYAAGKMTSATKEFVITMIIFGMVFGTVQFFWMQKSERDRLRNMHTDVEQGHSEQ